jgi:hypothetical protein
MDRPKLGSGGGKMILDLPRLTADKATVLHTFAQIALAQLFLSARRLYEILSLTFEKERYLRSKK